MKLKNNIKINNKIKEINNINDISNKFKAIIILYNEINKKELKVNDNKNESNEINNKESKDKNNITEHKSFDPSIYVKYGLTVEEILDYKETFDLFDGDKKGLINAEDLLKSLNSMKNDLKNNNTYQGLIENIKKKNLKEVNFELFIELICTKHDGNSNSNEENCLSLLNSLVRENKDKVEFDDLKKSAKIQNPKVKDEDLDKILLNADKDKDGKLSCKEFVEAVQEIIELL